MPGSVAVAAPSTVLPLSLCKAFTHSRTYEGARENLYPDGSSQRALVVGSSTKRWQLAKRLTATELVTLRDFYDARAGGHQPFYYYDPYDFSPKFGYDATGVATTGRYTVHFLGQWSQAIGLGRGECSIGLEEIA